MLFVWTTSNNGMGKIVCSTSLVVGIFTPNEFNVYIPIDASFRQLMVGSIGSGNGLSSIWYQALIWSNDDFPNSKIHGANMGPT